MRAESSPFPVDLLFAGNFSCPLKKNIPSPLHHPLHHSRDRDRCDQQSSGSSQSSGGSCSWRDDQTVVEEFGSGRGIINNTHHLPSAYFGSHHSCQGHQPCHPIDCGMINHSPKQNYLMQSPTDVRIQHHHQIRVSIQSSQGCNVLE